MPAELDNLDPEMDQSQDMEPEAELDAEPMGHVIGTHGDTDREGAMAKADLFKLANYSHKLYQKLQDDDQLEAWVQAKITKAADYLASVYHYLEYEMKFSEYGHHLDNSDTLSEGQRMKIKELLLEAKGKMKDLKKSQAGKAKVKKVEEGVLSGGERACTECGGTGMVYEEPMPIPTHVKTKAQKYNTMMKATKAAHKRMDANHNGIPDDEEVDEGFGDVEEKEMKVGDKKKTRTGELEKTSTGVKHTNTSYKDDGEAEEKSGKGIKSHAKAQSAAEKKEKAPAQKFSPKSAKTYGMKDGEKFDNRDKEKSVDETYGQGVYEAKKKGDGNLANNAKPYDKVTRGDVIAGRLGKDEKGGKTVKEAAKYRDAKYKDKLYTQEPRDYDQYDYGDDDYYNPKPDDYPGEKNLKGGGEFDHNDPLRRGQGIGRSGIKNNINLSGKRKGMPSRDQITSLKGSIKDAHGTHTRPNLPEAAKQTMSRAAKGHEKYGKEGMAALAKAGKEGKDLDKVRDKYNKYDESVDSGKKKCPPMSHIKKMCQDGKSVAEICKMHSDCDQKELKQMVADCKKKMDEGKKAAAMWMSVKETAAYMAEKKAIEKKDKPMKGSKVADEGNAVTGGLADKNLPIGSKIPGTDVIKKKQIETESNDFTRMQELTSRLNRAEKPMIAESREVDEIRNLTRRLLG
jgi:hypothetical protein